MHQSKCKAPQKQVNVVWMITEASKLEFSGSNPAYIHFSRTMILDWKEERIWKAINILKYLAAAIAEWISLRLPSCGPESNPKLWFFNLNCNVKRMKVNKKRPGLAHIKNIFYTGRIKPIIHFNKPSKCVNLMPNDLQLF